MKILFVCTLYDPFIGGGAEISLQCLVEGLALCGIEVVVLTIGSKPGLHQESVNGVRVWRAGIRNFYFHGKREHVVGWQKIAWHLLDSYNPFMMGFIRQVVSIEHPDVASCHNLAGWSVSAWEALAQCRVPIVQVLHDHYLLCSRSTMFKFGHSCASPCFSCSLTRLPHRSLSRLPVAVIGVSAFILNKVCNAGFFPNAYIKKSIHDARKPIAGSIASLRSDGPVFGFIGMLVEAKGVELLLQEFLRVAGDDWSLYIAGSGSVIYEATLKKKYEDPRVYFVGYVKGEEFYPSLDATVVPSLWDEPLGMVVAESLMYGIPVIASRRGGIPEMVVDNKNGLLFEPQGHELGHSLQQFVSVLPDWRVRSEAIRRNAKHFQDMSAWILEWRQIYNSVARQQNHDK